MRVLYSTCFADPWLKVAKVLKEKRSFEPIYWIGYNDDDSEVLVPKTFPHCIYQGYYEAWKGNFPSEIAKHFNESYISIDFIKEYASFELQAIKMMDRMDPDQYSFNFMERQRHFRNLIKNCSACLDYLKIDLVICPTIPHQLFDYVLYLLCCFKNIKFISLGNTQFKARVISLTSISSVGDQIFKDYKDILGSEKCSESLKAELPDDIRCLYEKILNNFSAAKSDLVQINQLKNKESSGFFSLFIKFIKDANFNYRSKYYGPDGYLRKGIPTYLKQKNKSIKDSQYRIIPYSLHKLKANRFKGKLKRYYESLTTQPNYNAKYVYFALHYQPEMTTSPCGDIFVDQRLCLEVLHKNLPPDHFIYIKEHPVTFFSHLEGHTSRTKLFYDDLLSYPRVRLIPIDSDPVGLIQNAQAVATVRGSLGWEAMALGKPVIAFGLIWYEKYKGVLKITDEKSASKISEFIAGFSHDERGLFAYLNALYKNCHLVYAFRGVKQRVNIPEAECIERLVKIVEDSIPIDQVQ